jgi:hypothetical protein
MRWKVGDVIQIPIYGDQPGDTVEYAGSKMSTIKMYRVYQITAAVPAEGTVEGYYHVRVLDMPSSEPYYKIPQHILDYVKDSIPAQYFAF